MPVIPGSKSDKLDVSIHWHGDPWPMEIFPTNFPDKYSIEGHTVRYSDFMEIAQGGPKAT
jgi:hypothetical protein